MDDFTLQGFHLDTILVTRVALNTKIKSFGLTLT